MARSQITLLNFHKCRFASTPGVLRSALPPFGSDAPEISLNGLVHSYLVSLPPDRSNQPHTLEKE
jgi:hypothetical protein